MSWFLIKMTWLEWIFQNPQVRYAPNLPLGYRRMTPMQAKTASRIANRKNVLSMARHEGMIHGSPRTSS
jgi:hypothetical protein